MLSNFLWFILVKLEHFDYKFAGLNVAGVGTAIWDFTLGDVGIFSGVAVSISVVALNISRIRLNKAKRKNALNCTIDDEENKDTEDK